MIEIDDVIGKFNSELRKTIDQMNDIIMTMKVFMSSQCLQNELFLEEDKNLSERISKLEKLPQEFNKMSEPKLTGRPFLKNERDDEAGK